MDKLTNAEVIQIDNMFLRDIEQIQKLGADSLHKEKLRYKVLDILTKST